MRKLSEAEWISRFEQVQGRKPKPDELQLAYQSGLIGISKNYNYIYILLGALVAIVVGIGLTLVSSSMKNVKQTKSSAQWLARYSHRQRRLVHIKYFIGRKSEDK